MGYQEEYLGIKKIKKYLVQFKGKKLGRFLSIKEAELVYNNTLLKYIKEIAEEYKNKIPNKLYNRLIEISNEEE